MKRKRFAPLEVDCFRTDANSYGWKYILPSTEYRHKPWYLWEFSFSWWKWGFILEFCRKDWKDYNDET